MKKGISITIIGIIIVGIIYFGIEMNGFAKGVIEDSQKQIQVRNSIELNSRISIDTLTKNKFAYIREMQNLNSDLFIKIDYVEFLTGNEAKKAEWKDEAYFIDGNDTITNITDGYYISNINSRLRTFRVKEKISVEYIIDENGLQKLSNSKPLNSKQIKIYIENETLLFFHIKKGIIERIDEKFLP